MAKDGASGEPADSAALAAGVVAFALAEISDRGPWQISSLMLGITLFLVIVSYVGPHRRTRFQSMAFASLIGTAVIPMVGFVAESVMAGSQVLDLMIKGSDKDQPSKVLPGYLPIIWIPVWGLAYFLDRRRQAGRPWINSSLPRLPRRSR